MSSSIVELLAQKSVSKSYDRGILDTITHAHSSQGTLTHGQALGRDQSHVGEENMRTHRRSAAVSLQGTRAAAAVRGTAALLARCLLLEAMRGTETKAGISRSDDGRKSEGNRYIRLDSDAWRKLASNMRDGWQQSARGDGGSASISQCKQEKEDVWPLPSPLWQLVCSIRQRLISE